MAHYLLAVHAPTTPPESATNQSPPDPEQMQAFMQKVIDLEQDMEDAGAFVFGGRLEGADAATVVRSNGDSHIVTDGPFAEAKELIAGFYIIEAEDAATATEWARRVTDAIGAPIELRAFGATGKAADHMPV